MNQRGSAVGVAVVAGREVGPDDLDEHRLVHPALPDAVQEGRGIAHGPGDQHTTGAEHPARLRQGEGPVAGLGQVVQRTQQEHGVSGGVGPVQRPGIADCGRERADGRRLVDVLGHGVDQGDPMALLRQPDRVDTGTAAHIQDVGRGVGQQPLQQHLGAHPLERVAVQASVLVVAPVVGLGLGG